MKNMASWLISIFIVMFWVFRVIVAYMFAMGFESVFKPIDLNTEIIVLFVSFTSILFIFKRKLFGGILYAASYGYYFGLNAYNGVKKIIEEPNNIQGGAEIFVSIIAIGLAISILIDLLFNKNRNEFKDNKNTYWFYKNKKYDRNLDERADKNQYRLR